MHGNAGEESIKSKDKGGFVSVKRNFPRPVQKKEILVLFGQIFDVKQLLGNIKQQIQDSFAADSDLKTSVMAES